MSQLEIDNYSNGLGNPSIQKLLFILTVHNQLPVNKLLEFSFLSESQLHLTLKKMMNINLVRRLTRGMYSLSEDQFVIKLKEAYLTKILDQINNKIIEIRELLKENDYERAFQLYKDIDLKFEPILNSHFSHLMNSISHEFLDRQLSQ